MALKRVVGQNDRQDYKEVHLECGHSQNFHKGDTVDGLIPCYMCDAPFLDMTLQLQGGTKRKNPHK